MAAYTPRLVDDVLDDLFAELPAIMLVGPRGCGKTTTALRRSASVLRLDQPLQADSLRADPDALLGVQKPPVLIDEWQVVPEVLGAVKRAVDSGTGGGRFLLTGSVRARRSVGQWAGTGRVIRVQMYGLTVAERAGSTGEDLLRHLVSGADLPTWTMPGAPSVVDYVEAALEGGFPEAVGLSRRARSAWLDGYRGELVYRDAAEIADIRSPERLAALLAAVAHNTAGTPNEANLAQAAGVDARTARAHLDLLEDLRVVERLPAWHSNRFTRLVKSPKFHITDTALAASLIGVDADGVLGSGDLLGRIVESFVAAQIRPMLGLSSPSLSMSHLRDRGGEHEVDLVIEARNGDILGIEVKASARVGEKDARHLRWMQERVGERFRRGVVFHTGPAAFRIDDRIHALPIAMLWRWPEGMSR
ncbi:ATP-binding protein [Isoptericola halotolerans]|uniref:ATP-binding protein n=1 Tax=Isoptericola halotolerans TaxID=300560 RepID=UPI0038903F03